MVEAVERIITGQSSRSRLEQGADSGENDGRARYRSRADPDGTLESACDPAVKQTFLSALSDFIHGPDAPATATSSPS
jgi:hypothetical protein